MEEVARAINAEYQQRFGQVLHNNIDKGLLVAWRVRRRLGGMREVYVWLVGQIGRPIDQPWVAVQLIQASDAECERIRQKSRLVIDQELNRLTEFCTELTEGK